MTRRTTVAIIAVALGVAAWLLGLQVGPGPSAINGGARYLLILGAAGFAIGFVERDLSWTALAGLYAGQLLAFAVQVLPDDAWTGAEPLAWQPVFILTVTLVAAVGGLLGALAAGGWRAPGERAS